MGCNCNKNASPTGFGSTPRTAEQQQLNQQVQSQQNVPLNGAQQQAVASGSQQSFRLRDSSGRLQSFGSALERNAYRVRNGGVILP